MRSARSFLVLALSGMLTGVVGCEPQPTSGKGFTLPNGNVDHGKAAFVQLNCHQCHSVAEVVDLPGPEAPPMNIRLGGKVARIGTYGELVTAIINPSHRLAKGHREEDVADNGQSLMKNYNDVLTVTQLIDLVAFLQSRYSLRTYETTDYPMLY